MKQLTCEMCGSTELVKQDGFFVCQTCGTKYSVEEAKKMMIEGTVEVTGSIKVNKSDERDAFLKRVFMFLGEQKWVEADEYCEKILDIDPENPEAYLGKIMAEYKICDVDDFPSYVHYHKNPKIEENFNYCQMCTFANDKIKQLLKEREHCLFGVEYSNNNSVLEWAGPYVEKIVVENGVKIINDEACSDCENLKEVIIPNSVEKIGSAAFQGCVSLNSINIPNGVKIIESSTFICCYSLTHIVLPHSVEIIESSAFDGCPIIHLVIPDSVTKIGDEAFGDKIKSIYIPDSVQEIGEYIFREEAALETLKTSERIYNLLLKQGHLKNCVNLKTVELDNGEIIKINKIREGLDASENATYTYKEEEQTSGCYVATCVYGSYDCPQVWTLRRYRDNTLGATWYGRLFIRTYYAISPTLVKWFGNTNWFKKMWKGKLDRMVAKLQNNGVEDTPYEDKNW